MSRMFSYFVLDGEEEKKKKLNPPTDGYFSENRHANVELVNP